MIKDFLKRQLAKRGFVKQQELEEKFLLLDRNRLTYSNDLLFTYHNADFLTEPRFAKAYALGKATDNDSLLKDYDIQWRIHVLCWAAAHAAKLEGDFVDCGVHTGIFSRAVIEYVDFNALGKTYYLLDTFEGLSPEYSTEEELRRNKLMGYADEDHDALYKQVVETFAPFNTKIIRGAVPATLPEANPEKVAYLSVDMNCVEPERAALEFYWDKLVPGGLIVLDDFGYDNKTKDQQRNHEDFARSKGVEILNLPTCQGLIIKPG